LSYFDLQQSKLDQKIPEPKKHKKTWPYPDGTEEQIMPDTAPDNLAAQMYPHLYLK
jgi:hypothetical protein